MNVVHFSYASDGGASRAGRRANLACRGAGLASCFAFVEGEAVDEDDIHINLPKRHSAAQPHLGDVLHYRIQWELIPDRRTFASNSLLTIPYPGVALSKLPLFEHADIIHLHWPTWGATPRAIVDWLARGKTVFWTLHDMWAMTGGCHYSDGCRQFETLCMKCPQLTEDLGFIGNGFAEKSAAYAKRGNLVIISPSQWLADTARRSAILAERRIEVVRNPVELAVFAPCSDRYDLRAALGIGSNDFAIIMASGDLKEKRKGTALFVAAVQQAVADGSLAEVLPIDSRITLVVIGKNSSITMPPEVTVLNFGEIIRDDALRDVLSVGDVLVAPSLEDNYPNMIIEAMACGTPVIGFDAGGIGEMIDDNKTGLVVRPPGSIAKLKQALVCFADAHFGSAKMRAACRAKMEAVANPDAIGKQLRMLYEDALGRRFKVIEPKIQTQVLNIYSQTLAAPDADVGSDMLRFPSNFAVASRVENKKIATATVVNPFPVAAQAKPSKSLLTVRTFHEHHSARSGPYQFVRHLSRDRYSAIHMSVPLGADLVASDKGLFQKAGALIGASGFANQGNSWLAEAEVVFECAQREVDIVHFIDGDIAGMLAPGVHPSLFKNGRRPKFATTFHQPEDVLKSMISPNILAGYDGIVALCRPQAEFLATLVSDKKIAVIPHGVDVDFFRLPGAGARLCRRIGPMRLLLVGHWLRDIKIALEAFRQLKASGLEFTLKIVSPRLPESVSDPSISVVSGLSDEQLLQEYHEADLLYLPLIDATANNAILEAMACGLPVVTTAVGGVPETLGDDAGILCEPGNVENIARGVLQLVCSPDKYSVASAAGRCRAEMLSWRRVSVMYESFYEQLCQDGLGSSKGAAQYFSDAVTARR